MNATASGVAAAPAAAIAGGEHAGVQSQGAGMLEGCLPSRQLPTQA